MDPRLSAAIAASRLSALAIRALGRGGGTSLPGRIGARVDRDALRKLSARLPGGVILIAGTNGKTTTATLLRAVLERAGLSVVANSAGANLFTGVTAALTQGSHVLRATPTAYTAVFEVDEASLPAVVDATAPRLVVVTNLFRDQLDRYGELESSAAAISAALAALPAAATVLLCADDPAVAALGDGLRARAVYYGLEDPVAGDDHLPHAADARACPRCGQPFDFTRVYAGHLGHYTCPAGDFARPALDIAATEVAFEGLDAQTVTLRGLGADGAVRVPVSGLYNTYNVVAAAAAARLVEVAPGVVAEGLATAAPAFGRLERVDVDGRPVRLMLAKNPAGFNEVLRASSELGGGRTFLVALNDRIADGRDISWIWDVDFERLSGADTVVLGGDRALDMRIRLKYAGLDAERVRVADTPAAALDAALGATPPGQELFVLPTYTAMLELRAELAARGHLKPFWRAA